MQTINRMHHYLSFLVLVTFTLSLNSCKEKLTREKAKEIISQKQGYPKTQTSNQVTLSYITIETLYSADPNEHNRPGKVKSNLSELERRGLITYDIELVDRSVGEKTWWDGGSPGRGNGYNAPRAGFALGYPIKETYRHVGHLTPLGSQYITAQNGRTVAKTGNIQFDIINGVAEEPDGITAQIQFTEKLTDITPVGEYLGVKEERFPKACIFKKYDDGWRFENFQ